MWYLFIQIWVWLLIAFVLGWSAHWFLCCRNKGSNESADIEATSVDVATSAAVVSTTPLIDSRWKPQTFSSTPDKVDDLKRIKGVGAVIEKTLNGLGVYQFSQIADWDQENVSWVEDSLAFPGRISREDWVNQALTLAKGGTTEFANRVDTGDVDYN